MGGRSKPRSCISKSNRLIFNSDEGLVEFLQTCDVDNDGFTAALNNSFLCRFWEGTIPGTRDIATGIGWSALRKLFFQSAWDPSLPPTGFVPLALDCQAELLSCPLLKLRL